jgi:uncharacterized membrane protein YgcG
MPSSSADVVIAVVMVWLLLWVQHWFPWQLMLRRQLPRLVAYVLGVLAMALPLTVLWWHDRGIVTVLWSVIVAAGAATVSAYAIDYGLRCLVVLRERVEQLEMRNGGEDRNIGRGAARSSGDGDGGAGGAADDTGRGDIAHAPGDASQRYGE